MTAFNTLCLLAACGQVYVLHQMGRGNIAYKTLLVVYLLYGSAELIIAYQTPEYRLVYLWVLLDVWAVYNLLKGLKQTNV